MSNFLEKTLYGNTYEEWGISVLIVVGALILNQIIKFLNRKVLKKIATRTKTILDDILFESLEAPFLFGVMLIAIWVAFSRLESPEKIVDAIKGAYKILTTLNVTWFFARFLTSLLNESKKKSKKGRVHIDDKFLPLIKRTINILVWGIGIITALGNAGISIGALWGALGVGGIAIALAAQDTVKNLLAGIAIFTNQPFKIGDRIRFDSYDGAVEDIGLRSTRIRTSDKRVLTIPNYKIMDAAIENVATEPMRKVALRLKLTYDTLPEQMNEAMSLLKEMPHKVKHVSPKDLSVAFTEFADSSLIITFVYYIEKKGDITDTSTNVNMQILNSFNNAGLNFAFPTQTIRIEK